MGAGCVRKIPGIQNLRSFELKMGSDAVAAGIKEYTHSPRYSGLTIADVFEGMAPSIFKGGIPAAGNAPLIELKTIDSGSDLAYKDALQGDSIESRRSLPVRYVAFH